MLETLVLVLLAVWLWAIAVLFSADLADRFLWVPVFLALTGVSASILPLVMSSNIALVANAATLILFVASVQMFRPKLRLPNAGAALAQNAPEKKILVVNGRTAAGAVVQIDAAPTWM